MQIRMTMEILFVFAGRILNRFSKDMGSVDEMMPKVMLEAIQMFLMIIGIICMVVTVNYWMLIPLTVFFFLFLFMRKSFLRTAQSIKRLESIGKCFVVITILHNVYPFSEDIEM